MARQPRINLNNRDAEGKTALFDAGTGATKFLVSLSRMDVNARDEEGETPLHSAVNDGKVRKVRALLAAPGIDPNIRDKSKNASMALDVALGLVTVKLPKC